MQIAIEFDTGMEVFFLEENRIAQGVVKGIIFRKELTPTYDEAVSLVYRVERDNSPGGIVVAEADTLFSSAEEVAASLLKSIG